MKPILVLLLLLVSSAAPAAEAKPVLLYSRYYNAQGETRYLPDGTFKDILGRLREHFEVRVNSEPITEKALAGVNVVLLANPSDQAVGGNPPPPHVTPADITTFTRYVRDGGGLIVMGNQENHNLETRDLNQLLAKFGMQFTNLYTDAKKLELPAATPVIGGLRWAYYTGNLVALDPKSSAKPRSLVNNDLTVKPLGGPRDQAGCLLGVSEPGKGRVVLVTDAGCISNDALSEKGIGPVAIKGQDNAEIFRRLAAWAAHGK
jgi:hypothetical protein